MSGCEYVNCKVSRIQWIVSTPPTQWPKACAWWCSATTLIGDVPLTLSACVRNETLANVPDCYPWERKKITKQVMHECLLWPYQCGFTCVFWRTRRKRHKGRLRKTDFYSLAPAETADSNCDQQSAELKILVLFLGDCRYHWEKSLCWNTTGTIAIKDAWQRKSSSNRPHIGWNDLFLSWNWVVSLTVPIEAR